MNMAGTRGPGRRGKRRTRAATAAAISAVAVLAVLAAIGALAITHLGSHNVSQGRHDSLSTKITSQQVVGLANLGATGQAGSGNSATLLSAGAGGVVFTPSSGAGNVASSQQWQADEMGGGHGGQSVLLFIPNGKCLTAVGSGGGATTELAACDSGLDQRWYHPFERTDGIGRDYWQLRSASNGRCLAIGAAGSGGESVAEMQRCSAAKPWPQLIMFWPAF